MSTRPSRGPNKFNTNRKIRQSCTPHDLAELASRVKYKGNPEHKTNPGDYCLDPPMGARSGKTLCSGIGVDSKEEALRLLREGIERGLISEQTRGGFPQHVWTVTAEGDPLEAVLDNRSQGTYHGYPVPQADPFRHKIMAHWSQQ